MIPCYPGKDNLNAQGMDGGMEKQKEAEKDKESDSVHGVQRQSADAPVRHQKAADEHKYHTLGYQVLFCHTDIYKIIFLSQNYPC